MKRKSGLMKTVSLVLTGVMLVTGCGGQSKSDSIQNAGTTAADEAPASEASTNEVFTDKASAGGAYTDEASADATTEELSDGSVSGVAAGKEAAADEYDYTTATAESGSMDFASENKVMADEDSYLNSCYEECAPTDYYYDEEYSEWEEKGFSSVLRAPLSTFAADVDTASYSNLRRLINSGYMLDELPEGAVRIEEMLNYFSYDYNSPKGKEPFGVTTQISSCPWNDDAELLMIGLKTEDINYSQTPASNLVFLLDVSGSMYSDDKLPLLQESFALLAENLTPKDKVSIVTYAADDRIVLEGARGNETRKIIKAVDSLKAGGGTYGSKGIETAYRLAEENYIEGGNNRIILATDGDLNIGLTSEEELEELITEKKESGIFLSVLGFGTGNIKDNKMETLADKGNGNYAYIDCLREANKVLVEEMSATLLTICKDVKFQVEFNPVVVESYRLLGYENRALAKEDFNDDVKDAGEIGAGHSVTALYEIVLKEPLSDMTGEDIDELKYSRQYKEEIGRLPSATAADEEWLTISIRYKKPAEDKSNLLEYPVGYESYTNAPTDDYIFAAAVAEFGLLASRSEYPEDASVKHVEKALKSIDLSDEYKEEFLGLVQAVK
ncbi:MAG: von Willebrand factor type A domain-containing protein [Eubacterium sp.]|nr:von Willebrand factor type A domain-containing protein [Eubacterium sp.]